MCLNFEYSRNNKLNDPNLFESEKLNIKNEFHLKNLKLKFSRKLTCYSFLLCVLYSKELLTQENIKGIIKLTPLERIESLKENSRMKPKLNELTELYCWFLKQTQIEKGELLNWISISENRNTAFNKAKLFAEIIFNLMIETENKEKLMFFLV